MMMNTYDIKKNLLLTSLVLSTLNSMAQNIVSKSKIPTDTSFPTDADLKREEDRLTQEQKEIFKDFKEDYKVIIQTELKNKIKENPKKKDELSRHYHEFYNTTLIDLMRNFRRDKIEIMKEWPNPGSSGSAPSGFGGSWGTLFGYGVYSPSKRTASINDAAIGGGFGFGNPAKYIGGSVSIVADSIYKTRKGKSLEIGRIPDFDLGGVHLKFSRMLPFIAGASIAYGMSHVLKWGYKKEDNQFLGSRYLSISQKIQLRLPVYSFSEIQYTFGYGNKNFTDFVDSRNGKGGIAPFFGIGTRVIPQVGFAVDYVRKELCSTLSYAPFEKLPFIVSLTATNILWRKHQRSTYSLVGSTSLSFL